MSFTVTISIPAYGVKEAYHDGDAGSVAAAVDAAMDEVAIYWMEHNDCDDVDEARERCDVEFTINVSPAR
jgi:hypothetical protein